MTYSNPLTSAQAPRGPRPGSGPRRKRAQGMGLRGQGAIAAIFLSTILAMFSPSPGVVLAAGGSLAALFLLLWRSGEPPILMFPLLYQWSVVAVKPYLSAFRQTPINELAQFGGNLEHAAYFAFTAIVCIAIGIRLTVGRLKRNWAAELEAEVRALPLNRVLIVTGALLAIGVLMNTLAMVIAPLRSALLVLGGFGAGGVFFLAYWCFKNRRGYLYLAALMIAEIGVGLTGFFSDFQIPVLLLCVAAMCARDRLKMADALVLTMVISVLVLVASFWSEVKQDYRQFMNAGTGAQVVLVSLEDRIDYLGDQITTFNGERLGDGFEILLRRHSYIDFLANTMDYVPTFTPHEHGQRMGRTVIHILTPRILFPDKPPTDFDTEVTVRYTGIALTVYAGTSISIGYLGELYIDFGILGALIACMIAGAGIGVGWRLLRDSGRGSLLLRYGLYALLALTLTQFGFALIKLVGGSVTAFIGAYLAQRYVLPRGSKLLRPKRPVQKIASVPLPRAG